MGGNIFMTCVVRTLKDKIDRGYGLIDIDTGKPSIVDYSQIKGLMQRGEISIENLELDASGEVKGKNGSTSRYTFLNPANFQVIPKEKCTYPLIIVAKMDLGRFKVTGFNGNIQVMHEDEIIKYANTEGIANGKIVESNGKKYLSAIEGEYPEDISLTRATNSPNRARSKMMLLGSIPYELDAEGTATLKPGVDPANITEITFMAGVKNIAPNFGGKKLKSLTKITFASSTIINIGSYAFEGCGKLVEIKFSEGLMIVGVGAFMNCTSLKEVELPNSLRVIKERAFIGCTKLKKIKRGPNLGNAMALMGVFPRGVAVTVR